MLGSKKLILMQPSTGPILPRGNLVGQFETRFGASDFALTGALVDQWNDRSGLGNHLTSVTAERPSFTTDLLGGRVKFRSNANSMVIPTGISMNRRSHSMYVVMRAGPGATTQSILWFGPTSTALALAMNGSEEFEVYHGSFSLSGVFMGVSGQGVTCVYSVGGASSANYGISAENTAHGAALTVGGPYAGGYVSEWSANNFRLSTSDILAIFFYDTAHSDANRDAVFDYCTYHYNSLDKNEPTAIVFDGDSITEGSGVAIPYDYSYPSQLCRLCDSAPKQDNIAAGGQKIQDTTAATAAIKFVGDNSSYTNIVVVAMFGHNDINSARSAAQVTADIDSYIASIVADSATTFIIGLTILPSSNFDAGEETIRGTVNTHIKDTAAFDAVVDVAANVLLDDYSDATYYTDGIHCTIAGNAVIASDVFDELVAQGFVS